MIHTKFPFLDIDSFIVDKYKYNYLYYIFNRFWLLHICTTFFMKMIFCYIYKYKKIWEEILHLLWSIKMSQNDYSFRSSSYYYISINHCQKSIFTSSTKFSNSFYLSLDLESFIAHVTSMYEISVIQSTIIPRNFFRFFTV